MTMSHPVADMEQQVELELLRIFHRGVLAGQLATMAAAVLAALLAWGKAGPWLIAGWLAATGSVAAGRTLMSRRFLRADEAGQRPSLSRAATRVRQSMLAAGIVWGLGMLSLVAAVDGARESVLYLIPMVLVSGAVPLAAPVRAAYGLFAASILLPFVVMFVGRGDAIYLLLGVGTLIYLYMMSSSAERLRHVLTDSLRLRLEKESLSQALLESRGAALDAQQEAERANRAKSEFLASMSHEIRTPMNAILGLTHLALDSNGEPQRDYLVKIKQAGEMLFRLLNDVLDLSKIEAGRMEVDLAPFELRELVGQVESTIGPLARERRLRFETRIAGDVPARLNGDAMRITQVLVNLLGNAIKFTAHGSVELTVSVSRIRASEVSVRFVVSDTGIGMTPDQQQRVFSAYAQADSSVSRRYGGTGLGLSISRHLVRLMAGEISLSSAAGEGSSFTVTLPMAVAADLPATGTASDDAQRFDGARILVVEDNAVNQLITRELLERRGARVEVADNGRVALELVTTQAFDLVLMDVMMPEMDGLEATRRLRADPATSGLPIIGLTANVNRSDLADCIAAGMNAHVGKPIVPGDLFARLTEWLPATTVMRGMASLPAPAFDATLARARYGDDDELLSRLLEVFIDAEADCVTRLRAALAAPRLDEARRICHTLKGLAAGFDADALTTLARAAEQALDETGVLDGAQLDELETAHRALLSAARRHLAQAERAVVTAAAAG